jgi:hypothetical protein
VSPWWWYVLALLAIGAVLSVGGDIARAIAGPKVVAPAPASDPGVVQFIGAPSSIPVECPRCKWHGVLVPLATPPSGEAKR